MAKKTRRDEETEEEEVIKVGYEVKKDGSWKTCKKGTLNSGWLYYEMSDGSTGYAAPETWRQKKK